MEKRKHYKSTLARVKAIRAITEQYYEPGNNSRCYKQVWRRNVYPIYGCCYRTYLNYLGIAVVQDRPEDDPRQQRLFE